VVAPGQPAPRVGPSYLYPDPAITPGVPNPDVTQATIQQTICVSHWTATIRPAPSYTDHLKVQQLQAARYKDKSPAHYEEDHLISLELGGHPRDPKNLWPEPWGTPNQPLTSRGPFPPAIVGAKTKDKVETALKVGSLLLGLERLFQLRKARCVLVRLMALQGVDLGHSARDV
jgi:hypothetical protein